MVNRNQINRSQLHIAAFLEDMQCNNIKVETVRDRNNRDEIERFIQSMMGMLEHLTRGQLIKRARYGKAAERVQREQQELE